MENKRILVVGAGYRGIKASLDQADTDSNQVYLIERAASIGGLISKLHLIDGKPASEILLPNIERIKEKENIRVLTNTLIEKVEKEDSSFNVSIRKKPIRIDESRCDNCGECWKVCPVKPPDRFNEWLINRNAVYSIGEAFSYAIEKETPFCQATCPVSLDIRGYVGLIADRRFKDAYNLIREKNPLPAVCGRVCTHPCEDACKRGIIDEPVSICHLKRFVADYVRENENIVEERPKESRKEKIAIIGSGPAGLAAAYDLAKFGYKVTILEKLPVAGGMLTVGIPAYRLPKDVLEKEIGMIKDLGVEIRTNEDIDKERFKELSRAYDAVFIGVGAHVSRRLGVEGEDLARVIHGVSFLRDLNLNKEVKIVDKVAVIGGGNVAMDAARSALRLGSKEVFIVYRRSRREMPASEEEINALEEEGIKIYYLSTPTKIIGNDGKVVGMECIRMELGSPDESGRRRPIPIEGSEFFMDVDAVIPAIGQSSDLMFLQDSGVNTPKGRWIDADPGGRTTQEGIFAGGDAVTGAATVIEAIAGGKRAAISIHEYLSGEKVENFKIDENEMDLEEYGEIERAKLSKNYFPMKGIEKKKRVGIPTLPVESRVKNFEEVELGYTEEMAIEEAKRCLSCRKCIGCGICAEVCPQDAIEYDQKESWECINVSSVIFAPEFEERRGGGKWYEYSNVVTSVEFERIISRSGPFGGIIIRLYDGEIPPKIAFVSCAEGEDLSSEYVIREAIVAKENGLETHVFFEGEMKGDYYNKAIDRGIIFKNSQIVDIEEEKDTKDLIVEYVVKEGDKEEKEEDEFQMVVLSTGFTLPRYNRELSEKIGFRWEEHNLSDLFHHTREGEKGIKLLSTPVKGVFVASLGWG